MEFAKGPELVTNNDLPKIVTEAPVQNENSDSTEECVEEEEFEEPATQPNYENYAGENADPTVTCIEETSSSYKMLNCREVVKNVFE